MRLNLSLPPRDGTRGGRLRRALERIGPSWGCSPVRRGIQTVSLVLFLVLFFYVCHAGDARPYAQAMQAREFVAAESFLALDPLVSLSALIAARAWVWSLVWAGAILLVCLFVPRGFCGYVCPLGTLIDLFDWSLGRRVQRARPPARPWWVHLRYYVLAGTLVAAVFGVLVSGFVSAIPVLTRGLAFLTAPLQWASRHGWSRMPPVTAGHLVSVALAAGVLALGFLGPRFWCRYACPTGAVFSIGALLRLTGRRVNASCVRCHRCVESCAFDAIKPDFTTRNTDCTFCQTCGGVCPVGAIQFTDRWHAGGPELAGRSPSTEAPLSRRGFLVATAGGVAVVLGLGKTFAAASGRPVVRPPGSVPEEKFLAMCVRCGSCLNVCPTKILQPQGLGGGLNGLWAPRARPDQAGCDPGCNLCGQVCPTGAIRALPLGEKRAARMGRAAVNEKTCLPHSGRGACQMCVDACAGSGHNAIEFIHVGVELDDQGMPIEDTGYLAPSVRADRCVGCGLCQARCYQINVLDKHLLSASAIRVEAGPGKEDRMLRGSYRALREAEHRRRQRERERLLERSGGGSGYTTDFP